MRIASSTIYSEQASAIDNQSTLYQTIGQQLSSGKSLTNPSDNPTGIAQDLSVRAAIGAQNTASSAATSASNVLTTVDGALAGLTSVLQKARELTVQGATDTLPASSRTDIANQVDGLLQEAIGFANTNVNGVYVFAGTKFPNAPPVSTNGVPVSSVSANANTEGSGEVFINGQKVALSTSLQESFNLNASDNSLSVFQTLINLRNTLQGSGPTSLDGTGATTLPAPVLDQSTKQLNVAGANIVNATTLGSASFATPLRLDNGVPASASFVIDGAAGSTVITVTGATTLNGGAGSLVAQINASGTGVTATYDALTQKVALSSSATFNVSDVPTPGTGATTTGNLTAFLGVSPTADIVNNLSRQIGDIDAVLNRTLNARATVGGRIQNLGSTSSYLATAATQNRAVQSGLEDTDIAKATTQFSLTQTVLQAAYATTTRLESKTLFDYL